jgi:hypothetical protein
VAHTASMEILTQAVEPRTAPVDVIFSHHRHEHDQMRRVFAHRTGHHTGLPLGQVAVLEKSHEIPAVGTCWPPSTRGPTRMRDHC